MISDINVGVVTWGDFSLFSELQHTQCKRKDWQGVGNVVRIALAIDILHPRWRLRASEGVGSKGERRKVGTNQREKHDHTTRIRSQGRE